MLPIQNFTNTWVLDIGIRSKNQLSLEFDENYQVNVNFIYVSSNTQIMFIFITVQKVQQFDYIVNSHVFGPRQKEGTSLRNYNSGY